MIIARAAARRSARRIDVDGASGCIVSTRGPRPIEDEEPPRGRRHVPVLARLPRDAGRRPLQDYPMDPTAWYRVRKSHERFYEEWVSKPHPDVSRAQLIDLARVFILPGGLRRNQFVARNSPRHRADAGIEGTCCRWRWILHAIEQMMDSLSKGARGPHGLCRKAPLCLQKK